MLLPLWEAVAGVSGLLFCQWEGVSFAERVALLVVGNRRDCTGHASFEFVYASTGSYREYIR